MTIEVGEIVRVRASVVLAAAFLLTSCTTVVQGQGQTVVSAPAESQDGVAVGHPCALLAPEDADALGYVEEGEFVAGDPDQPRIPTCQWSGSDPRDSDVQSLLVGFATQIPLAEYVDGDDPVDSFEMAGLQWDRYADPILEETGCHLVTEVPDSPAFVSIYSSDFDQDDNACDTAKEAAPFIAAQLPDGDPDPESTRTSDPG